VGEAINETHRHVSHRLYRERSCWSSQRLTSERMPYGFLPRSASGWPLPVERDVLARLACPVPAEAVGIHLVVGGLAPGSNLPRSHLGAGWVKKLDSLSGRCHRTGECLGRGHHFAGDLGTPIGKVIGHREGDWHELDAAHLVD